MQPIGPLRLPPPQRRSLFHITPSIHLRNSILNMIHYIIWVILFSIELSNNTNNNKCTGPMLTISSLVFWILVAVSCSWIGTVLLRFYNYWKFTKQEAQLPQGRYPPTECVRLVFITGICQFCLTLSAFVLMCIAFGSRDSCPDLQGLVLGYIILSGLIYGFMMVAVWVLPIRVAFMRTLDFVIHGVRHQESAMQQNQQNQQILVIVPTGGGYQQQVMAPIQIQEVEIGSAPEREPMRDGRV